jgi:hypothetical protein
MQALSPPGNHLCNLTRPKADDPQVCGVEERGGVRGQTGLYLCVETPEGGKFPRRDR